MAGCRKPRAAAAGRSLPCCNYAITLPQRTMTVQSWNTNTFKRTRCPPNPESTGSNLSESSHSVHRLIRMPDLTSEGKLRRNCESNRFYFSSYKRSFLSRESRNFPASSSCLTHHSCQRSSPFVDIEHGQRDNSPVTCDVQIETSLEHGITHFLQLVTRLHRENVGTLLDQDPDRSLRLGLRAVRRGS